MKKILMLGATGMAGHMISNYFKTLSEKYVVYDICHTIKLEENSIVLDIHDLNLLNTIIVELNPDIIINSIGILNKNAEDDPSNTIFINSYLPRYLEERFKNTNIKIIHLSTDCVFSGDTGNYNEISVPDGIDLYAKTKILGEVNNNKDLTVRTSIIGPELKQNGTGLFHWFMKQKATASGYSKVIWSGVTTLELGKCLDFMIENDLSGLYNLTSKVSISKYELLKIINSVFDKRILIKCFDGVQNDKSLISIRKDFFVELPAYTEMVSELKDWMLKNSKLYSQYFL
ncbi:MULTISPECIES: dTDP-4-dehydrorhamnose reductase family protein [Clostridium]|uniref:dTDP-4-dehydrorhamnose reductase family protein n=1 Tax=Clostridium TaxID=1485 RepID=UPI0013E976EB|nr:MULTISPECIES: SDR family oxidoreductase [Clostridium]MBW9158425.1 SDR family oxidoreductase [Clostridium tagluense]MBZ9622619.1 SDR family oxidoreductase [Clostridium sp. FP2]MBZ9634160.1 SDR family oxidoreductase [Clostridium sp. FP1]WLC66897.1 SDR family oxidoreductase [Clostridium tagluense]